jgi:hypothetical protein
VTSLGRCGISLNNDPTAEFSRLALFHNRDVCERQLEIEQLSTARVWYCRFAVISSTESCFPRHSKRTLRLYAHDFPVSRCTEACCGRL